MVDAWNDGDPALAGMRIVSGVVTPQRVVLRPFGTDRLH
jgi:hypothetical protein